MAIPQGALKGALIDETFQYFYAASNNTLATSIRNRLSDKPLRIVLLNESWRNVSIDQEPKMSAIYAQYKK